MENYDKIHDAIIAVQQRHHQFFESSNTFITDYIEFSDGLLTYLKFKNNLPQHIVEDVLSEIGK